MAEDVKELKARIKELEGKLKENSKKLNIYQKIQKARVELQKREIKKTGYNKYSNYYYLELSDFLPYVNEICDSLGLYPEFLYSNSEAWLTVYDVDNTEEFRGWSTPIEVPSLKGCSMIQNIGGTQKFARRYLYMMAFEIAETDTIDNGNIDEDAELGKQKINKASVLTINGLIDETNTNKAKFLEWAGVTKVEEITNAALGTCINMLNKKKKDLEKEIAKKKEEENKYKVSEEDLPL